LKRLNHLFKNNLAWASGQTAEDPLFFKKLALQQTPEFLWIGCSDSRVHANEIVGLQTGQIFVHRNVANLVVHTDFNCHSVIQFAVEILKIKHIIVCGHFGCGGIEAAMSGNQYGLLDNWLRHVQDVYQKHEHELQPIEEKQERLRRLTELNVIEQVMNISRTTTVQSGWRNGQSISVHGWVYGLEDGLLKDLKVCVQSADEVESTYKAAMRGSIVAEAQRLGRGVK
jgi:carbonic anhydrase